MLKKEFGGDFVVNQANISNMTNAADGSTIRKHLQKFVSRYVMTPASSQIQFPPDAIIF
jgi:hypothetical protein